MTHKGAYRFPGFKADAADLVELPESVFSEAGSLDTRKGARYTLAVRKGSRKLVLPRSEWAR